MADEIDISQIDMSPEQFTEMIRGASDADIETGIRTAGTDAVLARIFQGMQERFVPEKAKGINAEIQWVVTDEGVEHPYTLKVSDGTASVEKGRSASPRVTLTATLVPFLRLISGQENGVQLFMSGKLKVAGDLMFSQQVQTFFAVPS
jgi:putative sterol carrier protein